MKVIQIENGAMVNFQMNDKCAAGTGRFLDVMAKVLEVEVGDLGRLGAESTKKVDISSTCTVFAESEVISQLAHGTDKRDIINGVHKEVGAFVRDTAQFDDLTMLCLKYNGKEKPAAIQLLQTYSISFQVVTASLLMCLSTANLPS